MFIMVSIVAQMLLLMKANSANPNNSKDLADCGRLGVGLSVSSLITTNPPRQLQMSWWNANPEPGDFVALLQTSPDHPSLPLASIPVHTPAGHGLSRIQASVIPAENLGYSSHCLGYWVAYVRNDTVVASACLLTQPTWLHDYREELRLMKLKHMFVPGTHDSASYKKYTGDVKETLVTKYSITQEENILSQLIYGVRYLDLRVGYYKRSNIQWWANHGVKRIHPLREMFTQLKQFMLNTNEIVILDIQEFNPGFGSGLDVHLKLVHLLNEELGHFMALPTLTWEARLDDIWKSGRRLIVTYDNIKVVAASTLLWPAVEHRWGNVQTLDRLHDHIKSTIKLKRMPGPKPWAAMAELTSTPWTVITDQFGGLRQMAHSVNSNVTEWFRGQWGADVNIVAVDFFRGTGIVEEAIKWNRRRARQVTCYALT